MSRIVICGGPRTGKSTLFRSLALDFAIACGTDDWMDRPWDAVPDAIVDTLEKHDSWLLEGVMAPRVLRRWIRDRQTFPGVDVCYYLTKPMVPQTKAQASMSKGIHKVWLEVLPTLVVEGTTIVREVPRAQ